MNMAKKAAAETAKAPAGLKASLKPSPELAAVIGPEPLARTEAVSKIWAYIKAHDLQNPQNRREIVADKKLRLVFGTDKVNMFEMNKHLGRHLAAR
jgi:upstream activation factor subunit UAF30